MKWSSRINYWFVFYILISVGLRLINYRASLYLIYDIGRDLIILRGMMGGDLIKLAGPTTGMPGVFLGPLWYYCGLPGFALTQGSPYLVQLWYICIACLSIPLFWILSHRLFGNSPWARLGALLLAFIPGSIIGTNTVWNPMLSLPLMTGAILCLTKSRQANYWLYGGFFLLALALQSEFAYAIFFISTVWFLIPWIKGKFHFKTILITSLVILTTLIPQLLFELKHGFSMSKALVDGAGKVGTTVPQAYLWEHRPLQLWNASVSFFSRSDKPNVLVLALLVIPLLFALFHIAIKGKYRWKLIGLFAIIPYIYYMFWKGNYGYFFDYYLTPHFIFLVLLVVYGWREWIRLFKLGWLRIVAFGPIIICLGYLSQESYGNINAVILHPVNNAGIQVMQTALTRMLEWSRADSPQQTVFRIYTPNLHTENYDYLLTWMTTKYHYTNPLTVQSDADHYRYVLYEPEEHVYENRFVPWYKNATTGMKLTRKDKVGVLTLETWVKGN